MALRDLNAALPSLFSLFLFPHSATAAPSSTEQLLVPSSAKLHMHPDAATALPDARNPRFVNNDPYLTLRKVRDLPSGWTEVETSCGYATDYCNFDPSSIRVRLFIRTMDITPVLRRPLRTRLPDGTWHNLPPGSPVKPSPTPNLQLVTAGDTDYEMLVPPSAIGRTYRTRPPEGGAVASIFGRSSALGRHLPAKTRLTWSDGTPAGQLTHDESVDSEPGNKACIQLLAGRAEGLVCSDKTNIVDVGEAMDAAMKNPQGIPQ
jgi:hypothetical protein